ncbi:MAG: sodium-extruding oxaloacetate decarboxylase subunit alpha [Gammaproteobacteria bacterium]|nr:sodium-extruding oxaloacetate decarboxylase subunit alpha [Gammaproteobacteria bacterium]
MTDDTTRKPLGITDVVLRDAHQSLLATRMRIDDMLPIAAKLDQVGFWSLESWGGATFDACIRYLGEDPWERIRRLKAAMPNTPQQMLLRGQNLLGYRHYADDVVRRFVERAAENGVDVFRIFDAMNDMRNLEAAMQAAVEAGEHAQGTISYTVSPVHTIDLWVDLAKRVEDLGAHSIAIKDMAGLLKPYVAFELVSRLKETLEIPVHMQCHATTGLSTATYLKAIEAGIDNVDTAISSMSMTYGHSPTEAVVAMLQETDRDTGLDVELLEEIAGYFREVRKKYARFEGSLRGVDSRILVAQVPGGMLTNLESQLREQNAADRFDDVLAEIPSVREDLGFIPLVTPTSQIVGTQAVMNVLMGERYKSISREAAGVLRGEYGDTPAPVNAELRARVLEGEEPITGRPADRLEPELDGLQAELRGHCRGEGHPSGGGRHRRRSDLCAVPQVGLRFLEHRDDPSAFEPVPEAESAPPSGAPAAAPEPATVDEPALYTVRVNGRAYTVEVAEGGDLESVRPAGAAPTEAPAQGGEAAGDGEPVTAGLAGTIFKVLVAPGQQVAEGDVLMILEAMKMETEISAPRAGTVGEVAVKEGDSVAVGETLLTLA